MIMDVKDMKKRICSLNGCFTELNYRTAIFRFYNNWNYKIRIRETKKIYDKFIAIWNNPKISIFCCNHTRLINKLMKQQSKDKRLINKSKRIIEKHKLTIVTPIIQERNNLDYYLKS